MSKSNLPSDRDITKTSQELQTSVSLSPDFSRRGNGVQYKKALNRRRERLESPLSERSLRSHRTHDWFTCIEYLEYYVRSLAVTRVMAMAPRRFTSTLSSGRNRYVSSYYGNLLTFIKLHLWLLFSFSCSFLEGRYSYNNGGYNELSSFYKYQSITAPNITQ